MKDEVSTRELRHLPEDQRGEWIDAFLKRIKIHGDERLTEEKKDVLAKKVKKLFNDVDCDCVVDQELGQFNKMTQGRTKLSTTKLKQLMLKHMSATEVADLFNQATTETSTTFVKYSRPIARS